MDARPVKESRVQRRVHVVQFLGIAWSHRQAEASMQVCIQLSKISTILWHHGDYQVILSDSPRLLNPPRCDAGILDQT